MWNFKGYLWNSIQNILPIHWKMWILFTCENLRALRVKSSYAFLKRPPGPAVHNDFCSACQSWNKRLLAYEIWCITVHMALLLSMYNYVNPGCGRSRRSPDLEVSIAPGRRAEILIAVTADSSCHSDGNFLTDPKKLPSSLWSRKLEGVTLADVWPCDCLYIYIYIYKQVI